MSSPLPCTSWRSIPMEMFLEVVFLKIQFEFLGILLFLQNTDILKGGGGGEEVDREGIA